MSGDFVGARVRLWRTRRGLSQRALATLADLPAGQLPSLEAGLRSVPAGSTLVRLAGALRIGVDDLTGRPYPARDPRHLRAVEALPGIRAALAACAGPVLPDAPGRTLVELDAGVRRLAEALRGCDYAGAAHLVGGLVTDLGSASCMLTSGAARRATLRLLVLSTAHATRVVKRLGQPDLPLVVARQCHDAAGELGEPAYVGLAEYARGLALPPDGPAVRRALAMAAADALRPVDTGQARQVYGMLQLTAAWSAASAGDADGVAAHVAEAARVAARLGSDPADGGFAGLHFGPTNVAQWRVSLALQAGDVDAAVRLAGAIDPESIGSPSRRAAFHVDAGCALAAGRRTDAGALAHFAAAERIAPQHALLSVAVRDTVGVLLRRARSRAGGPALRALATRLGVD